MPTMRAKMAVASVDHRGGTEVLMMNAVAKNGAYPADGHDEDNSYARWSPYGALELHVANPALHGKFKRGDKFYVDFTPADQP
jgi:hypothetical protein